MKQFYSFFDDVSDFFVSLAFLTIIFLCFMGYRYYEIQTLYYQWLPIEQESNKMMASVLISIVTVFATLIFMVNAKKLAPVPYRDHGEIKHWYWSKLVLVLFAFLINFFFWRAWEGSTREIAFKLFACVMLSSLDYGFSHLSNVLREEKKASDLNVDLKAQNESLQNSIADRKQVLSSLDKNIAAYQKLLADVTCPHCQELFPSKQALNPHKAKCKKRPV